MSIAKLHKEVLRQIPTFARESIEAYQRQNDIELDLAFSDEEVQRLGPEGAMAITQFKGKRRKMRFRQALQSAPKSVKMAIIQHEIIHCYVQPFFGHIEGHTKLSDAERSFIIERTEAVVQDMKKHGVNNNSQAVLEEHVVRSINVIWGGDELEASKWTQMHFTGKSP